MVSKKLKFVEDICREVIEDDIESVIETYRRQIAQDTYAYLHWQGFQHIDDTMNITDDERKEYEEAIRRQCGIELVERLEYV